MFLQYSKLFMIIFFIFILFLPHLFIPVIVPYTNLDTSTIHQSSELYHIASSSFSWPIPGYTKISSPFGKRISPTSGASTYHQGIDIPAPAGTNLVAPFNSMVSFIGFKGSGGYTIILRNSNLEFVYHHVSPNYIIKIGDTVRKGQIIRTSWSQKCIWYFQ